MIGVFSKGIIKIPYLSVLLKSSVKKLRFLNEIDSSISCVAGWSNRPTAKYARLAAQRKSIPYLSLEDGFVRSFGTGTSFPPLSIVQDFMGIYYDSERASDLESLLNSRVDDFGYSQEQIEMAINLVRQYQISKYNHAEAVNIHQYQLDSIRQKILVVDQTEGDMSVEYGSCHGETFIHMLEAARRENPEALIFIKTHPEVSAGSKTGYFSHVTDDANTIVIRKVVNPQSLLVLMDRVYVATSTMGFEALLAGKQVSVFGLPWYAGWGVTDDRQHCVRRKRKRTVPELFAAAYMKYTTYLNPESKTKGDIFDVLNWIKFQTEMAKKYPGQMVCVGFRRWKAANIKEMMSLFPEKVKFVKNSKVARKLDLKPHDCLIHWGRDAPLGLVELSEDLGVKLLRMEDGFIRSVGLGSDLIRPQSVVLDASGIYFDSSKTSDLEGILNTLNFTDKSIDRAQKVRQLIVDNDISKYNIEKRDPVTWTCVGKKVILVPGQVEDDASLKYGCDNIRTNLELLCVTRIKEPDAYIVYKPHPDVLAKNRQGKLKVEEALKFADYIEATASITSCLKVCHEVHTMTSLTGFDALLREKKVVVYGRPFYAGWGLTEDVLSIPRRSRMLTLDELVSGVLIEYPIYWDWTLKGYTNCEAVLHSIINERNALEGAGMFASFGSGYIHRQIKKAMILTKAWL